MHHWEKRVTTNLQKRSTGDGRRESKSTRSRHRFPFVQKAKKENKKERTRTCAKCSAAYRIPRFRTKDQEEYQEKKLPMVRRRRRWSSSYRGWVGTASAAVVVCCYERRNKRWQKSSQKPRVECANGNEKREREKENSASSWKTYEWSNGNNCSAMQLQQPACNKAM